MTPIPPDDFICPITKKLMLEPMLSRYGNHFERKAILEWIHSGHNYCPVTGNPIRPGNLVSDKTLQWKIQYWTKKHLSGKSLEDTKEKEDDEEEEEEDAVRMLEFMGTVSFPDKSFICPLAKQIMEDPVMSKHGHNFERKAILKYLDDMDDEICPVSKKPLAPSDLVTNGTLQWKIRQWQLQYGDATQEMTRLELETKLSKAEMVSCDFHISDILRALTSGEEEGQKLTTVENHKPNGQQVQSVLDVLGEVVDELDD